MRWPRFLRRSRPVQIFAAWPEVVATFHHETLPDGIMRPVLDDPGAFGVPVDDYDDEPYGGGLTWEQFSESMRAVEDAYRDGLRGRPESGKLEPCMTDAEKVSRLTEIVNDLKAELGTIAAEAGQAVGPENATRLDDYVRGVLVHTNTRLTELGAPGYA